MPRVIFHEAELLQAANGRDRRAAAHTRFPALLGRLDEQGSLFRTAAGKTGKFLPAGHFRRLGIGSPVKYLARRSRSDRAFISSRQFGL